jgi:hypothetical protein
MDPESSLPCSQENSTGPYTEPAQSIQYHPILFISDPLSILSSHLLLVLPSGLFLSRFPTKVLHGYHSPCPTHPPWFDHSNYTSRGAQLMKLISSFPPTSCRFIPVRPKYFSHYKETSLISFIKQIDHMKFTVSRGSSVGIVTDWTAGVQYLAGERDLSVLHRVQTGSGAHPASYKTDTRGVVPRS